MKKVYIVVILKELNECISLCNYVHKSLFEIYIAFYKFSYDVLSFSEVISGPIGNAIFYYIFITVMLYD